MLDQQAGFEYTSAQLLVVFFFLLQLLLEYENQTETVKNEIRSSEGI